MTPHEKGAVPLATRVVCFICMHCSCTPTKNCLRAHLLRFILCSESYIETLLNPKKSFHIRIIEFQTSFALLVRNSSANTLQFPRSFPLSCWHKTNAYTTCTLFRYKLNIIKSCVVLKKAFHANSQKLAVFLLLFEVLLLPLYLIYYWLKGSNFAVKISDLWAQLFLFK